MSLCPESEYRASLTDEEFWEHVFHGDDGPDDYDPSSDPNLPDDVVGEGYLGTPCSVCGTYLEACGYDTEGRPVIHVEEVD
jgi:hypothetical protein